MPADEYTGATIHHPLCNVLHVLLCPSCELQLQIDHPMLPGASLHDSPTCGCRHIVSSSPTCPSPMLVPYCAPTCFMNSVQSPVTPRMINNFVLCFPQTPGARSAGARSPRCSFSSALVFVFSSLLALQYTSSSSEWHDSVMIPFADWG